MKLLRLNADNAEIISKTEPVEEFIDEPATIKEEHCLESDQLINNRYKMQNLEVLNQP